MAFNFFKRLVGGATDTARGPGEGESRLDTPTAFPAFDPGSAAARERASHEGRSNEPAPHVINQEEIIAEWLNQLPEHVRPYRLTDNFPRLAVKMAELWGKPIPLQNYLRSLVLDDRGGRQGFPEEIAGELLRLTSYVEEKIGPTMPAGFGRSDDTAER